MTLPVNLGEEVLYRDAEGLEKAWADVDVTHLLQIEAELIRDNWDPWKVQARNLPFLAFAMGVTLWDDDLDDGTKRAWIANQWEFKSRRGTKRGIKMALGLFGFELLQTVTPPQGFYASPPISKEEYDAWVKLMPELRIFHSDLIGELGPNEFIAGPAVPQTPQEDYPSFAGEDACATQNGPLLYGRKAVLRRHGVDTPLRFGTWTTTTTTGEVEVVEQVSTVGKSSVGFFANVSYAAPLDDAFAGATDEVTAEIYTTRRNVGYQHSVSALALTFLTPTLTPFESRFETDSDIGDAGPYFFAGDFVTQGAEGFAGIDTGGLLLADRVFLLDPDVTAPMTAGWSFAGVDRVGMPPFTAELLIDLHTRDELPAGYADVDTFAGAFFAMDEDMRPRERALDAVLAAGALRDRLLVDTAPLRPRTFADDVEEDTTFGEWAFAPL